MTMADNMEALAGVTAESMADEVRANAKAFRLDNTITRLVSVPLPVISSDDGLAAAAKALVAAIEAKGGKKIASKHFATDHSYSDHRIALESEIITWLGGLQ